MNARTDQSHIQVCADGASSPEGVGAAAALFIHGQYQTVTGIRLGDAGTYSTLDAELAGIILAVHLISQTPTVDEATIFTDSQQAVTCLLGNPSDASQALVKTARRALWRARDRAGGTVVQVRWCPGHSGVSGNELADAEAKAATRNRAYPPELVPTSLRDHRPLLNAITVKKLVKEANREAAKLYWRSTAAGRKFHLRYPHLSPFDFLPRTSSVSRSSTVLLFRLITSHIQLNQHLHRLRATDTPSCEHCESIPETVVHFLLRCPAYADDRALYLEALGSDFLRLDFLFSAPEALSPFLNYIRATGRFRDSLR